MSYATPQAEQFPEALVRLAWHSVVYDDEGRPQCTACLSPGNDACPVMQIVLSTECPFPDEPDPDPPNMP